MIPLLEMLEEELKMVVDKRVERRLSELRAHLREKLMDADIDPSLWDAQIAEVVKGSEHQITVNERNKILGNLLTAAIKASPLA